MSQDLLLLPTQERRRRQEAVDYATASMELSGFKVDHRPCGVGGYLHCRGAIFSTVSRESTEASIISRHLELFTVVPGEAHRIDQRMSSVAVHRESGVGEGYGTAKNRPPVKATDL
jgi:hypothetical protein